MRYDAIRREAGPTRARPVVVCDDDLLMHQALQRGIEDMRAVVFVTSSSELFRQLEQLPDAVVLLDICLADKESGLSVLSAIRQGFPKCSVIMWSGRDDYVSIVDAIRRGAVDYVPKAAGMAPVRRALQKWTARQRPPKPERVAEQIFSSQSSSSKVCLERLEKFKNARGHVLITGEAGVGKSLLARRLNVQGGPWVELSARAEESLFSGAADDGADNMQIAARVEACWRRASGGILFVEKVEDLDRRVQRCLVQCLDASEARASVCSRDQNSVRVLAATRHDSAPSLASDGVDSALIERLSVLVLRVPPLRERREDIAALAAHFVGQLAPGKLPLDRGLLAFLGLQSWPGNVRQLANALQFGLAVAGEGALSSSCLDDFLSYSTVDARARLSSKASDAPPTTNPEPRAASSAETDLLSFREKMREAECTLLREELRRADFSVTEMAARIGLSRTYLYEKLRKAGLLRERRKLTPNV